MSAPPSGTVTFLFTDIEGSTRLAQQFPAAWSDAKARHNTMLKSAIESHGGYVFQVIGDAFCAAFHTAPDALAAAMAAQRGLTATAEEQRTNGQAPTIRVRMGIHTGAATARPDGDYDGYLTLARVQRIMSAANGEQVLMSRDVADLISRDLPAGVSLHDLGTHRLKDLSAPEHLCQLLAPGLRTNFPPLKTADHPNNLPVQLTSFIGREAEVAEVRRLLAGTRLLTLTGSGGVGKTRLALQAAVEELRAGEPRPYEDGVWFVELASVADPALIPRTIAAAVGVREEPSRPLLEALCEHFSGKTALLALDNCEHVLADAARACDRLLHAAPALKIIATSREALAIAGEQAYRVPSLHLPDPEASPETLARAEAVRLFVERARAAKADFALSDADAPVVTHICRRLDGIPLAIEFAAARVRSMVVPEIAARLDDRFRILTGGSRTALPRQQTLRATIDWSCRLLSEPERVLLRRLSVFAGGCTLEAAEAVCAGELLAPEDVLDLLTALVDKSLVIADSTADTTRYRMLETVRQYAREMLDSSDDSERVRDRHLAFFERFAETMGDRRRDPATQLPAVRAELDNLRSALTWALDQRTAAGLHLIGAIAGRLRALGNSKEAYDWVVSFLERDTGGASVSRVRALAAAGVLAANLPSRYAQGQSYAQESVALGRFVGDKSELAVALASMAIFVEGVDTRQAQGNLEEALRLALDVGEPVLMAIVNNSLGEFWRSQGEDARARFYYEQGLAHYRRAWDKPTPAILLNLAFIALREGEAARAHALSTEALTIIRDTGARFTTPYALACLGGAALLLNQPALAVRLSGAAAAVLERFTLSFEEIERAAFDRHLALARSQLGPAAFEAAFAEGRAMSYDEAIAYALEGDDALH